MSETGTPEEFRPERLSRRGEVFAWLSALILLGAAGFFIYIIRQPTPWPIWIVGGLTLLAALGISLANWMDRRTLLRLEPGGVAFRNGLRSVRLGWEEIREVRVLPAQWSKKVQVIGAQAHFEFHTLGEVKVGGELKGRVGFAAGERILRRILEAGMLSVRKPLETSDGYSYVRR